jgi:hypothetical protein
MFVFLIFTSEYDQAILKDIEKGRWKAAREGVDTLSSLFMATKNVAVNYRIQHFIVTGIIKLTHTSLFSGANNFIDMTNHELLSKVIGFTKDEIRHVYADELKFTATNMKTSERNVMSLLKYWYNGYCFDGKTTCFNPFPVLKDLRQGILTEQGMIGATDAKWLRLTVDSTFGALTSKQKAPLVASASLNIKQIEEQTFNMPALLLQIGLLTLIPSDNQVSLSNANAAQQMMVCKPPNEYARVTILEMIQDSVMFSTSKLSETSSKIIQALCAFDHKQFSETIYAMILSTPYELAPRIQKSTLALSEHDKVGYLKTLASEAYIHRQIFTVLQL